MPLYLRKLDKPIRVLFDGKRITWEEPMTKAVRDHWMKVCQSSPHLTNGTIYAFREMRETGREVMVIGSQTDYAHYLYARDCRMSPPMSSLFVSALLKTNDQKLFFGRMGTHTSSPGMWQFAGGSLDPHDLSGSEFDLEKAVKREIREEIGLDLDVLGNEVSLFPKYLKRNGNTGVFFEVRLPITSDELLFVFQKHEQQLHRLGQISEFSAISFVPLESLNKADSWLSGGKTKRYLKPLLEMESRELDFSR